jgi:hypothetical protein
VVGRIARFRSGEGKEVRHGGGTGLPAGVDGSHAGGAQVEEDGEEGQGEGVEGEEEAADPQTNPPERRVRRRCTQAPTARGGYAQRHERR